MPCFMRDRDRQEFGLTREVRLLREVHKELKNAGLLLRISNIRFMTQRDFGLLRRTSQLNLW